MSAYVRSLPRFLRQLVFIVTALLMGPLLVWACKYSVRDVGFVVLEPNSYLLRLIVPADSTEIDPVKLQSELSPLLRDSNIHLEILASDSDQLSAAQRAQLPEGNTASAWLIDTFSTSNQTEDNASGGNEPPRELSLDQVALGDNEKLRTFFWGTIASDLREELIDNTLKSHSVLLIVEGEDGEANAQAQKLAADGRQQVQASLADLPKPIEHPSEIITLSAEDRRKERVLLWSWGIDPDDTSQTYLLPIFGRGRLLGEPLTVPGTSLTELSTILSYVGQDCECELDRSWMQGKMFPHRWDEHMETVAAKSLDFDPGSSLVKSEITRILARGPNGRRNLGVGLDGEGDLINLAMTNEEDDVSAEEANDILRELNILSEIDDVEPAVEVTEVADAETLAVAETEAAPENAPANEEEPPAKDAAAQPGLEVPEEWQTPLEIAGFVTVLIVLLMLFRGRQLQKK